MTIFLIDDNSMYLQVTMEKLKPHCSKIYIFSNYKDALNNFSLNPDIIFLDYLFEDGLNGEKILKKIRLANPKQKIVIVSGQDNAKTVHQLISLGVHDYIIKEEGYITEMVNLMEEYAQEQSNLNPS